MGSIASKKRHIDIAQKQCQMNSTFTVEHTHPLDKLAIMHRCKCLSNWNDVIYE